MSKLLPEQSNLIIIGSWNPAIIQHQWLKSEFPEWIEKEPTGAYLLQGDIQTLKLDYGDFAVQVNQQNLIFTFSRDDDEILDRVSNLTKGIYGKLKHTPVLAAGCNFVYELAPGECFNVGEGSEESKKVEAALEGYLISSRELRYGFSGEDHSVNIRLHLGASKKLHLNYDYRAPREIVVELMTGRLKVHLAHSKNMVKKFIRTEND
jgi:hypothetical protein